MQSIEIDFDVFKALTLLRHSERDSYNDVLRNILKLPANKPPASTEEMERASKRGNVWQIRGVIFSGRNRVPSALQRKNARRQHREWEAHG
jgi:hypothetical protein